MDKILVIGHRNGIGGAIYNKVGGYGISKSTGFDINDPIYDINFKKYDCIILNAYDQFTSQLKLLFGVIERINKNILVIVISSTSAYKTEHSDLFWAKYSVEKNAIIKSCRELNLMGYNTSVISPGTTDTYRNKHKKTSKLSPGDVANEVERVINNYDNGILLEHVVVRVKK